MAGALPGNLDPMCLPLAVQQLHHACMRMPFFARVRLWFEAGQAPALGDSPRAAVDAQHTDAWPPSGTARLCPSPHHILISRNTTHAVSFCGSPRRYAAARVAERRREAGSTLLGPTPGRHSAADTSHTSPLCCKVPARVLHAGHPGILPTPSPRPQLAPAVRQKLSCSIASPQGLPALGGRPRAAAPRQQLPSCS